MAYKDRGYGTTIDNYNQQKKKQQKEKNEALKLALPSYMSKPTQEGKLVLSPIASKQEQQFPQRQQPVVNLRDKGYSSSMGTTGTAAGRASSSMAPISTQRMSPARSTTTAPISEGEFNRSSAMQRNYGTYQNYLNGKMVTGGGYYHTDAPDFNALQTAQNNFNQARMTVMGKLADAERKLQIAGEMKGPLRPDQEVARANAVRDYQSIYSAAEKITNDYFKAAGDNDRIISQYMADIDDARSKVRNGNDIQAEYDDIERQISALNRERSGLQVSYQGGKLMEDVLAPFSPAASADALSSAMNASERVKTIDKLIEEFRAKQALLQEEMQISRENYWNAMASNLPDSVKRAADKSGAVYQHGINIGDIITDKARYLTDEEKDTLERIVENYGTKKGKEYYDYLSGEYLNTRRRRAEEDAMRKFVGGSDGVGEAAWWLDSVLLKPLSVLTYAGQMLDYLGDGRLQKDAGYNRFSYLNTAIRSQVQSDFNGAMDKIGPGWKKYGDFGYQFATSTLDFLYNWFLSAGIGTGAEAGLGAAGTSETLQSLKEAENLSLMLMGTEVAADTIIQAKDRGLSDGQAIVLGNAAGVIEIFSEKVSVEALLDGLGDRNAFAYLLKNFVSEGSEEGVSSLMNKAIDVWVSKDQSEWRQAIRDYKYNHPGASDEEALKAVWGDAVKEVGMEMLAGGVSGLGMGFGFLAANNYMQNSAAITNRENVANVIRQADGLGEKTAGYKAAQALQAKLDTGDEISVRDVQNAMREIDTDRRTSTDYVQARVADAEKYTGTEAATKAALLQEKIDRGESVSYRDVVALETATDKARATSSEYLSPLVEIGKADAENSPAHKAAVKVEQKLQSGQQVTVWEAAQLEKAANESLRQAYSVKNPTALGNRLNNASGIPYLQQVASEVLLDGSDKMQTKAAALQEQIKSGNINARTAGEVALEAERLQSIQKKGTRTLTPREVTANMDAFDRSAAEAGVSIEDTARHKLVMQALGIEGEYHVLDNDRINAYYDNKTGRMVLNARSNNLGAAVIAHEVTHSLEKTASYQKLADMILKKKGGAADAILKAITDKYESAGITLDSDGARSELVAEYVEKQLLTNEDAINEAVKQDRSFGEWMRDKLDDLLAKLGNENAQERKFLRQAREYYVKALGERDASRAAKEKIAQKRGSTAGPKGLELPNVKEKTATEGGEQYSINEFANGRLYVDVDVDQTQFDGLSIKEQSALAEQIIRDRFSAPHVGKEIGSVYPAIVKYSDAQEYANPRNRLPIDIASSKMRASTELDHLLDASEYRNHEDDDGHHPEAVGGWDYYDIVFRVGNGWYRGLINIMNTNDGPRFHDITFPRKNYTAGNSPGSASPYANASGSSGGVSYGRISQPWAIVNAQNAQNNSALQKSKHQHSVSKGTEALTLPKVSDEQDLRDSLTKMRTEFDQLRVERSKLEQSEEYGRLLDRIASGDDGAAKAWGEFEKSSGYGDIVKRMNKAQEQMTEGWKKLDQMIEKRMVAEERAAIKKSGLSESEYFRKEAVKEFGYTPHFYDAGYILPNGKMLNFSGEKGRHFGTRGQDHRAIGTIYANEQGSAAMIRFMKDGNIRIMAESPGLDISNAVAPTREQYATIRRFINEVRDEEYFNLDFTDERGNTIGSIEYDGRINTDRVLNDIRHFFETGEVREQSIADRFRYSVSSADSTQQKIDQAMTMQQAKDMIQRAFVLGGIKEWYDGEYRNGDEWLKGVGVDDVALVIDNEWTLQDRYINQNEDILNEEYSIEDVLEAYLAGTLTGRVMQNRARADLSKGVAVADSRFYAPQQVQAAKETLETALQRITNSNRAEVTKARAQILLYAHNPGAAETLGLTNAELNKRLRQWSNYSTRAKEVSQQINRGVADAYKWSGIENSSWLYGASVTNDDVARLVNSIEGDGDGYQTSYIARTMLALDTHIDWSWLNIKFDTKSGVNNAYGGDKTSINGYFNGEKSLVHVNNYAPNTVAHEMGHALDYRWGTEFGQYYKYLTRDYKLISSKVDGEVKAWVDHFGEFCKSLWDSSSIVSEYSGKIEETFARFVDKFVEWTQNLARGQNGVSRSWYNDRFTTSQFVEFAKLLQEKAALDAKGLTNNTIQSQKEGLDLPKVERKYSVSGQDTESKLSLPVAQEISSAKTSLKQVPALFTDSRVKFGKVNVDIGGGRFDLATNYLKERGTQNLLFDPYNRDRKTNRSTLQYLQDGNRADTATCANVLNVIAEPEARANVILEAAKSIKDDGTAYFMVYEGDGSGNGKRTSAGWQNNMKTAEYVSEIEQYFDTVERKGKLIIASDTKANLPQASWEVQPGEGIRYSVSQQTTSDAFKKWFGDWQNDPRNASKVVNEDGTPMVVYHGTTGSFTKFAFRDIGFHIGTKSQAESRVEGEDGAHIMPLYADIKNPLVIDRDFGDWHGNYVAARLIETEQFAGEGSAEINARLQEIAKISNDARSDRALREYLQSIGYDGIKYENWFEGEDDEYDYSYIAFKPSQLKSASDNIGTFDRNNPDIRYSVSNPRTEGELKLPAVQEQTEQMKKKEVKPVAKSKAISARNWINQQIMSAFGIKTNKTEAAKAIQKMADKVIAEGAVTDEDVSDLFYELYDKGAIDVFPDEYSRTMRDLVLGGQIHADESLRADFGDDWNYWRKRAFAAGLLLTNTSSTESSKVRGLDSLWHEISEMAPGTFNPDVTDPRTMMETIIKAAEDGKKMQMNLGEYLAYMDKEHGLDMTEAANNVMDRIAQDMRTFGEMAGLELKLRDRTGKAIARERERFGEIREKHFTKVSEARQQERARFREAQRYQREQRQLRELQEKTMKQLKWMRKNQFRAPADMASEWADLVADMDMYAIHVARETQYSKALGMTYGDAKAMYDELVQADNNFTPSAELDRIMTRLTSGHIGDMDVDSLQAYYNALTSMRHEFYQRNNAILGDELEAFADIYKDTKANMKAQKGKMRGIWDIDFMTPVNVLKKMVGWNQSSRWMDMVNDLERGERKIRDFTVRANRMLDDFKRQNAKWLSTADGQGKNGQWIEVQVPVYDWVNGEAFATGEMQTVYMTPLQRVHLYLESKGHANMNHIAGGRTFADKDLYSQGKRANAFAKGTTVSMNEATVKRILQDMSQEELELAKILEKFYNEFSRPYINETSQKLWGYNKAIGGYYAPIISNRNFTHQELGIGDTTAKGVGNMKLRQPHAKNASVNISALEAFDRSVQQTARFYGMGTVERNWNMLLNWHSKNTSMRDVISNAWTGKENAVDYIENLIREMQGNIDREDPSRLDKFGNRLLSNYVGATFGTNPGITLKQAASFPTFATVLGWKNMPSPTHIARVETKAYEDLINTYTSELAYRTMGYASPETAQLVNNPGLIQRNKTMNFLFGGGMIIAMDAATVKSGWAWAENYVDSHFNLEKGTQTQIENGESPYYKKVAEVFEDAVATTQPMYDIMHRAGIMRKSGTFTRAFTMFRTVPMQMYNSLRRSYGEFDYAKQQYQNDKTGANKTAMNKAATRAASATAAIVVSNLALEAIEFLNALWKNRGKKYRDDDDELTVLSVLKEIGIKLIPDTAMVPVLKELTEMFTAKLLGRKWYGIQLPGGEQLNDLVDTIGGSFESITDFINGAIDVQKNGEDLGLYFKRHAREYAGAMKDTVEKLSKYLGGLPLENLEKYIMGAVQFSPELTQAVEDVFQNPSKNKLKGKTGKALERGVKDYFDVRGVNLSDESANAISSLYEAGYGKAVPPASPSKLTIMGSEVELSEAQMQQWERVWAEKANVEEMLKSKEFQNADDETKEKLLTKLYDFARIETNRDITEDFWTTDDKWPDKVKEYVESGHTLPEAIYGQVTGTLDKLLKGETPESIAAAAEAKAEKEAAEDKYRSQTFTFKGTRKSWDDLSGTQKKIVQAQDAIDNDPNADLSEIIGKGNATKKLAQYQAARDKGISNQTYIDALQAIDDADDGNGTYNQKEAKAGLEKLVSDGTISEKEAGIIWKIITDGADKNNPFPMGAIISRPMGLRLPKIG